jgi:hypothetical protein
MKIGKKFNTLSADQYFSYIDNHKKYSDFNTLGLYRSIIENTKLNLEEKLAVRDYAHRIFRKSFDFLQLKDPRVFMELEYLGQELTKGDIRSNWEKIRINQQKILTDKRIKHRNFGTYSKHDCGYENCIWQGMMIRRGSWFSWGDMHFNSDRDKQAAKSRFDKQKVQRKTKKLIISKELNNDFETGRGELDEVE